MMMLLAVFAAFGLWRLVVVLRSGVAERTTGLILLLIAPLAAGPVLVLAWLGEERDIHTPVETTAIIGGLGAVCVLLGIVLLVAGKKREKVRGDTSAYESNLEDWGLKPGTKEKTSD